MFERIKSWWKGVRQRMFGYDQIKNMAGRDFSMSKEMFWAIADWKNMLEGKADWIDHESVVSLKIEQGICREFADVVLNEMENEVNNNRLDALYQKNIKDLNETLQEGLGLGSFIMKPLPNGKSERLAADQFVIFGFDDDGKPNDVMFLTKKAIGENKHYTRAERHYLQHGTLTIENKCYFSEDPAQIGKECPLADVPEWSNILPGPTAYAGMDKMDFGYFRTPLKNRVDGSACGVSIFFGARELIKRADIQYGRLDWEYDSGERAVHVDERALIHDRNMRATRMPNLKQRLYRGLNIEQNNGELMKEYSPDMRDEAFIRGLEKAYRQIEFVVGLAYGDLSDVQEVDKTATEIKASKQRKYNRVTAIQENLKDCLTDFVDALAFHNGMYTTVYELTCRFNDSILTDEDAERAQDRQDVAMGAMTLLDYRMKWYQEEEAEALKHIASDEVPPDGEEE